MDRQYFKNKYRTSSTRLSDWNYAWPGLYFVTICTHDRQCCMSQIQDDRVILSEIGEIVNNEWLNTPILRPNVFLRGCVIMPNHFHGIIEITDITNTVETHGNASLPVKNTFGPQYRNLGSIVRGFKGSVVRQCNKKGLPFHWQSNYYEHIIRDEDDYARISEYIRCNPGKWAEDRNNYLNIKNLISAKAEVS